MSKFKVRRSVPTVRLTGTQSLVTSGVNYVSTNPPQWITTPAPVFHEGYPNQQFDLGAYIYNYNQTTDSFSLAPGSVQLPSWLTFSGSNSRYLTANGTQVDASDFTGLVIRVTRAGLFSNSQPISVSVTSAIAFTLTSQLGGSDLPWAFGHAFRQGDISTGQSVVVSGANSYQCSIKTTWPDGSAKFAVLSGKADFTAGVAKVLSLVSGTASSGTTLTTTHLQATGITAEFDAGAYGTATFSNADFSSFAYLWVSGHVMSSWTFRKAFSGDSNLVAWMEVRLYQGGAVEVLPWVENGFMTGSTATSRLGVATFTLGGTQRFSENFDGRITQAIVLNGGSGYVNPVAIITDSVGSGTGAVISVSSGGGQITGLTITNPGAGYVRPVVTISGGGGSGASVFVSSHAIVRHGRQPFLTGSTFAYWLGTDPQITPAHNRAYLMSTKLVPNYGWTSPSESTLNNAQQTYTPNTLAGVNSQMGTAGSSAAIINNPQARYITSNGDLRAYNAAIVFGLSGGSWSTHYRDASTHTLPLFSSYAAYDLDGGTAPQPGSGTTNGTPVTTHQPSYGYLPFLITGKWWFWEEGAFWTVWNYLKSGSARRRGEAAFGGPYYFASGSAGVLDTANGAYANRGAHWSLRTLAQTFVMCPSSHSTYNEWKTTWENNTDFYNAKYVAGTFASGWVSPQGYLGDYGGYGNIGGTGAWWGAGWMSTFGVVTWGFASEIGLPQSSASETRHLAIRNHTYKQVVVRAGDGTEYNWRRFCVYSYPLGSGSSGPPTAWFTPTQSYSTYLAGFGLASIPATEGLTLKEHSSDTDLFAGSSTATDYGAMALGALAYAVEHGAPGASAGWLRITGASNFSAFSGLNNNPEYGFYPRNPPTSLPSWVPAEGTFANISLNTLLSAKPTGWPSNDIAGPFANWSGGIYAADYSSLGAYVVHGSGHLSAGAALWSGVNVFDLDTLTWSVICRPSTNHVEGETMNDYGEYPDGHLYPPHTYDGLIYQSQANGGGTKGSLISHFLPGGPLPFHPVHRHDLGIGGTTPPTRIIDHLNMLGSSASYPAAAVDTSRGGWWVTNANGQSPIKFVAFSTWAVTTFTQTFNAYGDQSLVYLPLPYDCLVAMGRDGGGGVNMSVRVLLLSGSSPSGNWVTVTQSGSPPSDRKCGGHWSTFLNCIVSYQAAGSYTVHKLTPPAVGSLTSGTWAWTSETLTGVSGATPSQNTVANNGAWSRFIEVPEAKCFIWCDSVNGPVQAWRLTGMT